MGRITIIASIAAAVTGVSLMVTNIREQDAYMENLTYLQSNTEAKEWENIKNELETTCNCGKPHRAQEIVNEIKQKKSKKFVDTFKLKNTAETAYQKGILAAKKGAKSLK